MILMGCSPITHFDLGVWVPSKRPHPPPQAAPSRARGPSRLARQRATRARAPGVNSPQLSPATTVMDTARPLEWCQLLMSVNMCQLISKIQFSKGLQFWAMAHHPHH